MAEALDSGGSDMEMDRGFTEEQDTSPQHRAKTWKVGSRQPMKLGINGEKKSLFIYSVASMTKDLVTIIRIDLLPIGDGIIVGSEQTGKSGISRSE